MEDDFDYQPVLDEINKERWKALREARNALLGDVAPEWGWDMLVQSHIDNNIWKPWTIEDMHLGVLYDNVDNHRAIIMENDMVTIHVYNGDNGFQIANVKVPNSVALSDWVDEYVD